MVDFGCRLKNLRIHAGLTQVQVSERLNLSKSVISAYENGNRLPSYDILIKIARIFNVTTDYLLGVDAQDGTDLSGLAEDEKAALVQLIKVMRNRRIKKEFSFASSDRA